MKARTVGINATIPAVIGVEVALIAALVIFPPGRTSWWPTVAVGVIAAAALLVTVYRRNAFRWIVDRMRWRMRRRRSHPPAPAVDIPHGASLYGVRVSDRFDGEAITMIEVTGQAYSPTLLTGSATTLTPNLLPLDALTGLLDQPGGIRLSASMWCPAVCACDAAQATRRCTPPCLPTVRRPDSAGRTLWCASTSPNRSQGLATGQRWERPQRPQPNAS
jgi:type VII secretion protein EccE